MTRKFYLSLALVFCLTTAFKFTQAGENLTERIIVLLDKYRTNTPQEKVYLHFDKPYYMAGETMWFKGYLFDGIGHEIDTLSRTLYVDLIDETLGKTIASRMLRCSGSTNGDITLPDSLAEGVYQIRAYTNYMRNFSEEYFFHQEFKVWQGAVKNRLTDANAQKMVDATDVQFFPEGGNSVIGLNSRIGFKALNKIGKGVDIQGVIIDNFKDTVTVFTSEHLGMGFFTYKPEAKKTYYAIINQHEGKPLQLALPKANEHGFTMAVDNLSNKEIIKVFVANNSPKSESKSSEIVVVVHQRGQLCFTGKSSDSQKSFAITIPKYNIPNDGIVQVTLLNTNGEPLCERIIFNNRNEQISLKITPDKSIYKTREKVTLSLEATDIDGKPVEGNFSVAVTDANQVISEPYQGNLLTYLLLSSDASSLSGADYYSALRGNIEQPAYYFEKENLNANYHLDILMMTQGWRRFNWQGLMADKLPAINYLAETGLEVTGKAVKSNGKIADNLALTLMIKHENQKPQILTAITDSEGKYGFYGLDFFDSTKVYVQGIKKNGNRDLDIAIDPLKPSPKIKIVKIPYNPLEVDIKDFADFLKKAYEAIELEKILKLHKNQMLESVSVNAKRLDKQQDTRVLYSPPSSSLVIDNQLCSSYFNIFQLMMGRFAGVTVTPGSSPNTYNITIRGISSLVSSNEPLYLLDGMPVNNIAISIIPPCDLEKIDVLKGAEAGIYGMRGSNGVISFLTKQGNVNHEFSKDIPEGMTVQKRWGYYPAREFYAPKYDVTNPDHIRPDFRSTLHWQPNVKTDANGKATITYWNTDAKSNIRIIAEGVSKQGMVGVSIGEYSVN
jgi:TonB-dependent SusC/RagA subfamily outer membrane receptor